MQPLRDLKILDFTSLLPGPFATLYFADWGADVLRIESPDREDLVRHMPPIIKGTSTTHAFLNRSKKALTLDLKAEGSRSVIHEIIQTYDVVIEQFRPGVMEKLGLDYASLAKVNKRLIYCSLTGYGQTGPYRDRAGHDINYAALSGLAAMTGSRQGGPVLHGNPVCDMAGSFHAIIGILMALYHRARTGEGQYIDVSMTDSSLFMSGMWLQMALAAGANPGWESTPLNGGSFYGYYQTKDQRYLSVGGLEPKFLGGFLEAIDGLAILNLDLTDPRNAPEVKREIQSRIETRTLAEWLAIFSKLDVCVEPVLDIKHVLQHPQFMAREMTVDVDCGDGTKQTQLASPLRFSQFKPVYRHIGVPKDPLFNGHRAYSKREDGVNSG